MKSKNIIELNGHQYDTVSGAKLNVSKTASAKAASNIDGFFRATAATSPSVPAAQEIHVITPATHHSSTTRSKSRQHQAVHTQAHKPQPATTLMRKVVKRPEPNLKQQVQVQSSLQHKVPSLIASKSSAYSLDEARLRRAETTDRSPLVSRHAVPSHQIPVTFAPLAVQPVPVKPEAKEPVTVPEPSTKPLDMFEHAIANASHYVDIKAHQAKFKKHRRNHALSLATGGLALIVIAGFVAYQNSPSLQFKVASIRSGVTASMPDSRAIGFAYEGAKAGDDKLVMNLSSHGADYKLVQQTTNLSADDVINNVGSVDASGNPTYSTVKAGDTTVYRFNNNDATWVSGGKWYTVSGNQALTDTQVTDLVKNL